MTPDIRDIAITNAEPEWNVLHVAFFRNASLNNEILFENSGDFTIFEKSGGLIVNIAAFKVILKQTFSFPLTYLIP